eukprot:TCONS_00012939-protein
MFVKNLSMLSADVPAFETLENSQSIENTLTDFMDFKKYVTDSLGMLDNKIEKYQSTFEVKDVVIKLLREELKTAQENLKMALEQNSVLSKQLSTTKIFTRDSVDFSETSENMKIINEVINDIPFDKSLLSTQNDPLKNMRGKDQLSQVRSRNHNLFLSKKEINISESTHKMTHHVENQNIQNENSIVGGILLRKPKMDIFTQSSQKSHISENLRSENALHQEENAKKSTRKQVIICGDSLLNNIEGNGISNKKTKSIVRNFPGADSQDMISYLRPVLIKKQPNYLILHVGTNDITYGCNTEGGVSWLAE